MIWYRSKVIPSLFYVLKDEEGKQIVIMRFRPEEGDWFIQVFRNGHTSASSFKTKRAASNWLISYYSLPPIPESELEGAK